MSMVLQANNIKKQYGIRTILDFEKLFIYEGDKIGIVGLNGAGKSILMGILSGEIPPDEGNVQSQYQTAFIRQFDEKEKTLSGGECVKKRIQYETGRNETIVFADEPTANLDAEGIQWIKEKLMAATTVVLISHDRELLDAVCNQIVEVKDGNLRFFTGNYSGYLEQCKQEENRLQQQYEEYKRKKAQLEAAILSKERTVTSQRATKKKDYRVNGSEARLGGHTRAAKLKKVERGGKVLEARLERLEKVEKIKEPPRVRFDFSLTDPPRNKHVITCENLDFSYGAKEIFKGAGFRIPGGKTVALTGKNGSGKTTLLHLIYEGNGAVKLAPKLKIGYLHQGFENLRQEHTVLDNVLFDSIQDMTSVRSILSGLLFYGDDVHKKVKVLSGGERVRLSLAILMAADINCLLLDEPTNYLDIRSLEAVQDLIKQYPGTVLLVSHDKRFVQQTADYHLEISNYKIREANHKESGAGKAKPADKMLLEFRRVQLVSQISSAPSEQKKALEMEYNQILQQLREVQ